MGETEEIFKAVSEFVAAMQLPEEIHKLKCRINRLTSKRCGNCDHSMKTSCPRHGKCGGNSVLTSTPPNDTPACNDFMLVCYTKELVDELTNEIVALKISTKSS